MACLFLLPHAVGCSIYKPTEYRIETYEAPVTFTNNVSKSRCVGFSHKTSSFLPITSVHDIPCSLLWLFKYLELHQPDVILPDVGSEPLKEIVSLVQGCRTLLLSTQSTFRADSALPRLATLFTNVPFEQIETRFKRSHAAMLCSLDALTSYSALLRLNICDVVERPPMSVLFITAESLSALQITRTEAHPCDYQNIGSSKEGLSLLSVVDLTCSYGGKLLLRQWFSLPSADLGELQRRQAVVSYFASPERRQRLQSLRCALRKVSPCSNIFTRIRCGKAIMRDYKSLFRTIRGMIAVYEILEPCAHEVEPLYATLVNYFNVGQLRVMEGLLGRTLSGLHARRRRGGAAAIVPNQGAAAGPPQPGEVGIHTEADRTGQLAELRSRFGNLSSSLQYYAQSAIDHVPAPLRSLLSVQCAYVSNHGYLLCINRDAITSVRLAELAGIVPTGTTGTQNGSPSPGVMAAATVYDENISTLRELLSWVKHHEEGDMCTFKNEEMTYLDQYVGDITQRIRTRELEVRKDLDGELLFLSLYLLPPQRALAELDCLLCFAECAYRYQWTRPALLPGDAGTLEIRSGWHAVLGRGIGTSGLTPFSFSVAHEAERINIIAGCNGSGKTVLLGAVASIVFLAQIGSFVPAASASLCLFHSILTLAPGAPTQRSHCQYSSFSAECIALNQMLRHVDSTASVVNSSSAGTVHNVLILLDELGRGTDPDSGQAILEAALRYWGPDHWCPADVEWGARCRPSPFVLCATHYLEMMTRHREKSNPLGDFPFESMRIFDMRSNPVRGEEGGAASAGAIMDVIPLYEPVLVTTCPGSHQEQYRVYQEQHSFTAGPMLARQVGLMADIVDSWEEIFNALQE